MSQPSFEGEFSTDPARRAQAGRDFGRLVERIPGAVLCARSGEDVVKAIEFARSRGISVSARGQGHCTRGQAQVQDGLVVDTRYLDGVEVGDGWVDVGSGCTWRTLLRRTLESGQSPPTLTDYLGLSVGGTLSVGGVGGQSFRHGMQTDNVLALTVVTGTGESFACSRVENPELFYGCLGGVGQFGIIIEARVRLLPAPRRVAVYELRYGDAQSLLADQELLMTDQRFDYVLGNVLPEAGKWGFSLEVVKYLPGSTDEVDEAELLEGLSFLPGLVDRREQDFFAYADRLHEVVEQLKAADSGRSFHPWMDLFVAADSVSTLMQVALDEFRPEQLSNGYVMTYPLVRGVCDTPFVHLPDHPHCFLFDVLPHFAAEDVRGLARFEASCRRVYDTARELGSTVYPIGYPVGAMSEADWRRQLGASWVSMCAAKRRFDPDSILTPGVQVFPMGIG